MGCGSPEGSHVGPPALSLSSVGIERSSLSTAASPGTNTIRPIEEKTATRPEYVLTVVGSKLHLLPMELGDVDRFVSYWHDGEADLDFLGIDRAKLGDREASRARYVAMCDYGHPAPAVGFSILLDERLVGFTNVNLRGRAGYVHIHLVD